MLQSTTRRALTASTICLFLLLHDAAAQTAPENRRCLTREQLNIEPIFSACPELLDQASVSDNSFIAKLYINGGPSRYSMRWSGPSYFNEDEFIYNESTGLYDGLCGTRACSIGAGGWVQSEHWDWFVGTLLAENAGTWTYEELHDGVPFRSRTFEVNGLSLRALSGEHQTGIVGQQLAQPLILRLESFEGRGIEDEVIGWTVDGPRSAKGAAVYGIGSGSETDADGRDAATILLGSKPGSYTLTLNNRRVTAESRPAFTFTAIDDIADTDPATEHPDVEEGVGEGRGQRCDAVGNPITLSIGNKFQREVDLAPGGISPIEFVRYHNSLGFISHSFANYWTHTYDRHVEVPVDLRSEPVKVIRPDGRKVSFIWDGGAYRPSPGTRSGLEEIAGGWRFTDEDSTVENFDADGLLLDITDTSGRTQTATYDGRNNLVRIQSNTGNSIDLAYDGDGRLSMLTDQAGRSWTYGYETLGRLAYVENPDGTRREYHYEDLRHAYALTGITLENGQRFSWYEYDEQGRVTASYHADDANRVDVGYESNGDRIVLDSRGNATVYRTHIENRRGILDAISGPICSEGCGQTDTRMAYDDDLNVTSRTVYGVTTRYGNYNARGEPGFAVFAAGTPDEKRIDYEYDPRFLNRLTRIAEPSVHDGQLRVTSRSYDARGNLLRETISGFDPFGQPVSRTIANAWEGPFGQLTATDGPRTDVLDVTRFEYYPDAPEEGYNRARLRAVIDPNGIRLRDEIAYSATGKVRSEVRPDGVVVSYEYADGSDRIQSITESADGFFNRIRWEYFPTGDVRLIVIDDEAGDAISTRFGYDAARRLTRVESRLDKDSAGAGGQSVVYSFDAGGNVIAETHRSRDTPSGDFVIERVFDAHERLTAISQGGVTLDRDYNPDGSLAARTDGNGTTTTYGYDAFRRLTTTERLGLVVTRVRHDTHGNPVSVTDAENHTTHYLYDDLGNRVQQDSPDSGITSYSYNGSGQVLTRTDAKGQATAFTYDAGGRLTAIDRPGSDDDVIFTFDDCSSGTGRLCAVTAAWGHTVHYGWNALGELASVTTNEGGIGYTFGPGDTLTSIGYPSGRVIVFDNDGGGLPVRIRLQTPGLPDAVLVDEIGYSALGRPVAWRYANGLRTTLALDARHRASQIEVDGLWQWRASGYDANDNLLGVSDASTTSSYSYDAQNRLISAAGGMADLAYTYDRAGNRLSRTADGVVEEGAYEAGTNRIIRFGPMEFTLDENGNTTTLTVDQIMQLRHVYSSHNRLIEVIETTGSSTLATYRYDGLGQRVEKISGSAARRFMYGADGELLVEMDGGGRILHEYVYLGGAAIVDLGEVADGPAPAGEAQVFDDEGALVVGSNWQARSSGSAENGSYVRNRKRADRAVHWYVDDGPIEPGRYDVFVKWLAPAGDGSRTTYRVVTWNRDGGSATHSVDVDHAGLQIGDWAYLGNFEFSERQAGRWQRISVLGSDNDAGLEGSYLHADAVKLVPTADPVQATDVRFLHSDHLGTPQFATDGTGQIVWSARYLPFGEAIVDQDPDADGNPYVLNLRLPGQYFDSETGLHYNYFRTYDPAIGRYRSSDPVGLDAGPNTYLYAGGNPLAAIDPLGLTVEGRWIKSPRFNFEGAQVDDWSFTAPSMSAWGYLQFIRIQGRGWGYVNIDVRCSDVCEEWEIHRRIALEAQGSFEVGPNLYALGIGFVTRNPLVGIGANLALGGSALLQAEYYFLDLARQKAGPIISATLSRGPTLMCLASQPDDQ